MIDKYAALKKCVIAYWIGLGLLALISWILAFLWGGRTIIEINQYGEAYFELIFNSFFIALTLIYLIHPKTELKKYRFIVR